MNTDLQSRATLSASVDVIPNGFRLTIPDGDNKTYRAAQLDDYAKLARRDFPQRFPLSLSLRARASANSLPGTWGFGLWNDPFGLSLGFGGNPLRIPALPNALWFFHASEENYLSFGNKPGNGFLAQTFRSPVFSFSRFPVFSLVRAAVAFPFSRKRARAQMGKIIEEDGIRLSVDVTEWHAYRLEWSPTRSAFWVDDELALETSISPSPPLGLVIWIDNQYAAFSPEGKFGFGLLENIKPAWLEIENLTLR